MIKAVIFDFFGVLATRGLHEFKADYLKNDPVKVAKVKELQNRADSGQLGYDNFIDSLAKIAGTDRATVLKYTEDYQPNNRLLNYIEKQLKPAYKLGIISNSGTDWVQRIIGDRSKLFDDIILSYKVEIVKPQPDIYKMSVKNLVVEPAECVFVDDILTYCDGAESVGMKTIWYKNFAQATSELEKVLAAGSDN